MTPRALAGLRVLDGTQVWAGPTCTKLLGDMGAEVIKVESARRLDVARGEVNPRSGAGIYPDGDPQERPWNRAGLYNDRNRNKRNICLDLTHPRGVDAFKRLAAKSDVVTESFRSGVMERFGLGYDDLRQVRDDIIMVSLSSQGATGPERAYGSFGATLEQTAGIASMTGYRGGDPTTSGTFFPDPVVAVFSVGCILAAVRQRDRTGRGTYLDLSQREVTTSIVGEMVMDYTMNGRRWEPIGNRHRVFAPQGVYPCAGDDMWIAITVRSDAEWAALARVMGRPELAEDPRLAGVLGRRAEHDRLDATIAEWTCQRDAYATMRELQAAGVAAGVATQGHQLFEDPQLVARGFWEEVDHPEAGRHPYLSRPFKLSKTPGGTYSYAPLLGEHTEVVLREVAGMSDEEIRELTELGVTSNDPTAFAPVED
ncbi:MAG: CoA transferase [Chloroflexi bacterium]|nr:CoA transferase [Chloroflexota bacterium]